jgi:signal transduction histidine kinase
VDVAVGLVALVTMPWLIGAEEATTWADWVYPITLFTACAGGACFRARGVVLASGLLMAGYLLEARHVGSEFDLSTLLANALSYPLFAAAAYFLARLLRRLGNLADQGAEARATLAGLQAGEIVRDQVRPLVHAYDNVVAGVTDARMPSEVREAFARDGVRLRARARAFLEGRDSHIVPSVPDELASLAEPGGRPGVCVHTEQWDLTLDAETARALLEAVDECVLNARKHARASQIIVTARSTPALWSVTVVDDGVGFDTTAGPAAGSRSLGHGLRMLQGPRLARLAITCTMLSVPGGGTIVTLQGTP